MDALTVYLGPEPRLVPLSLTNGCTAQVKELTFHTGASALFDSSPREEDQTLRINTDPTFRELCLNVSTNSRKPEAGELSPFVGDREVPKTPLHVRFSPSHPPSPPGHGIELESLLTKVVELSLDAETRPNYTFWERITKFIHKPKSFRQHGYINNMCPCPPSPPPEAPSPPASPPSHATADPIISVPNLQRPLTPTEQLLGKQCRSNSDGDGPPQTSGKQDRELLRPPHTLPSTTTLVDALSIAYGIAYPSPTHEHNPSLLNRLIDKALSISLIKSSRALTPTTLMEAAWTINPTATPLTPLVEVLPLHYDALFSGLSDIHQDSAALEVKGIGRPLVLVVGDTHGGIASMFCAAGADVATSY